MKTIAIAQQKGGTGKTTTAHATGAGLKAQGKRVLFVDLDPQANLTYIIGAKPDGLTVLDVLNGTATAAEATQDTESGAIIPGTAYLAGADATFAGKVYALAEALKPIARRYDFCILDTPPALGALTVAALAAADSVIIPCLPDVLSIQALGQIAETISEVRASCNPRLEIAGVLLTRYTPRQKLTRDTEAIFAKAAEGIGSRLFKTHIRETVSIREAQAMGADVFSYSPKSAGATDYNELLKEIF